MSFYFYTPISFLSIFILLLAGFFTSCACGDQREAELSLIFVNAEGDTLASPYRRIYGIGGNGEALVRNDQTFPFVLSVVRDTVVYVLEATNQAANDTLAVSYSRSFNYRSDRCGFEVDFGFPRLIDTLNTFDRTRVEIQKFRDVFDGKRRVTTGFIKVRLP